MLAVLLHGQPGSGGDWDLVVEALAGRIPTLVPDRPGYDGTPARDIGGNASFVASLLDGPAIIVGYSWSGAVALDLALRYPSLVAALVLVASVGGTASIEPVDRFLTLPVVGPLATFGGLSLMHVPLARRLVAPVAADRLKPPGWGSWRSFVVEQRALTNELPGLVAGADAIAAPSVVVIGETDYVVRPAAQEQLAATLGAAVVRVPGCGHLLPWEAPGVIADAILQAARSPDMRTL